jgi:hypothetical protein
LRGKVRRGPLWKGRRGKFERGMVGFVAAGGVRCVQVRSVIGMSRQAC